MIGDKIWHRPALYGFVIFITSLFNNRFITSLAMGLLVTIVWFPIEALCNFVEKRWGLK